MANEDCIQSDILLTEDEYLSNYVATDVSEIIKNKDQVLPQFDVDNFTDNQQETETDFLCKTALKLSRQGFSVIPLMPKEKKPKGEWKKWQKSKRTEQEIIEHWSEYPDDNIGIITGQISNLVVYDCDSEGTENVLCNFLGGKPDTYIVRTGRGAHYYFRYPQDISSMPNKAGIVSKLDVRGDGGYVVAEGSIHPNGHRYLAEKPLQEVGIRKFRPELFVLEQIDLKKSLQPNDGVKQTVKENAVEEISSDFLVALKEKGIYLDDWAKDLLPGVSEGSRNDALTRLAGALFARDLSFEKVRWLLSLWNKQNSPPLKEKELNTTLKSISQAHKVNDFRLENLEILGVDEQGRTGLYSKDTRITTFVDLPKLSYDKAIQIVGEEFAKKVSHYKKANDDKRISSDTWKKETILTARRTQLGKMDKIGQGVWGTKNADTLLIVNGNSAIIFDGKNFNEQHHPIFEDKFIEFSRSKKWIDGETFSLIEHMTPSGALEIIDKLTDLIRQWGFKNEEDYDLIAGFILGRFVQSIWSWRPHIWLSGPAGCGKSKLIELIDAISGPLAITQQGKASEAGIRQKLQRDLLHLNIDEFEKCSQRDRVIELFRSANRGGYITKGTPSGTTLDFYVKHMFLVASIEVGLVREAEKTRFIVVEWEKDLSRNPIIPSTREIECLRKEITAVALWSSFQALILISKIELYKDVGGRMLETYSVPMVFQTIAEEGGFEDLREKAFTTAKAKEQERQQIVSDELQLLETIAFAKCRTSSGEATIAQLVANGNEKELELCGIKLINDEFGNKNNRVFLVADVVRRELLKGTMWEGLQIRDILKRCPGAQADRRRVADRNIRGISIPIEALLGETKDDG
jgi:hypothetical protein